MFEYEVFNSEEEAMKAKDFPLLDDGAYRFRVVESKHTYSAAGNAMIKLKVVINHEGQDHNVFGNLVGVKSMAWLVKHFCEAVGLEAQYKAKQFNADMAMGREGVCLIGNEPAKPYTKDDGTQGVYKAKNVILDFVPADMGKNHTFVPPDAVAKVFPSAPASPPPPPVGEQFDKDLPF